MRDFYRINVVKMGFKHEYIMRTLLSLSGLQLAHYRTESSDHYLSLALAHHQSASQTAMALMTDVNSETAPMLFLFSNLTTIFGMLFLPHLSCLSVIPSGQSPCRIPNDRSMLADINLGKPLELLARSLTSFS